MARVQIMFGPRPRRRGFTMIEILIVIGILAVLASIVLLGMRHITGKSKEQQTRVSMQNLRNMLAEYNARTRMKAPREWYAWDPSGSGSWITSPISNEPPNPNELDFWRVPYRDPFQPPPNGKPAPIGSPGTVEGTAPDRNGLAVVNTAIGVILITSLPENRNGLQSFKDKLMSIADDANTAKYIESDSRIPLDAWNNPIILVPGSGMYNVTVGGQTLAKDNPVKAQDNQPFWASAGPDGDFQKGDDNIYSFEE